MKTLLKSLVGAATVAAFAVSAQAMMINGSISIGGAVTPTGSFPNVTSLTFVNATVSASTQTGAYVGTDGSTVTMDSPLSINPLPTLPLQIWSFVYNSDTYSFELNTMSVTQDTDGLKIIGSGTADITGGVYDPTPGVFRLTTQSGSATVSFSATTNVPDSGTTALLLGLGLLGLALGLTFRRAKSAA